MFTVTCNFRFTDGAEASAKVTVGSPEVREKIEYSGAVSRLPNRFEATHATTLKLWAQQIADQVGAELSITEEGEYDTWAE